MRVFGYARGAFLLVFGDFVPVEYPNVVIHGVFSFVIENGEGMSVGQCRESGEVCGKSREELAKSWGLFLINWGLLYCAPSY